MESMSTKPFRPSTEDIETLPEWASEYIELLINEREDWKEQSCKWHRDYSNETQKSEGRRVVCIHAKEMIEKFADKKVPTQVSYIALIQTLEACSKP